MIERYSREIALREQLRLFVSQHYPDDAHIYDHIWESLWQITGSNQIEDFVNISGWHFRPTAIEDGGMSGGACSPETVQAMLCAMHVTTNIYIDDADDVFSVPHIESRLQEAGAKLNLARASIQILKD